MMATTVWGGILKNWEMKCTYTDAECVIYLAAVADSNLDGANPHTGGAQSKLRLFDMNALHIKTALLSTTNRGFRSSSHW